jgi:hypothetical protein
LRYHLRGFRYAETLWQPFRWHLGEWLYGWQPPEKQLIVVGSSAGWCVQPFFFERFAEVTCLEPDPIAHRLFRRRLDKAPLENRPRLRFEADDHLLADPSKLQRLLAAEPGSALLFTNIVGQLRVLLEAESGEQPGFVRVREAVASVLPSRSYASFHDRVSGSIEPAIDGAVHADSRLSDAELIEHFYPVYEGNGKNVRTPAIDHAGQRELLDHLTEGFFPAERPHSYFSWQLLPGTFHLIEATRGLRPT